MHVLLGLGLTLVASAAPGASAQPASSTAAQPVPRLAYEVLARRPHDSDAFTQGLQLDEHGTLFESTGLYGRSSLRAVDPSSGTVLRLVRLPDDRFGEGLALVGDRLIQLTWRSGEAYVWDAQSLEALEVIEYQGQGWGLCYDGKRLVMSDGSSSLTFRDPLTFAIVGSVDVTLEGKPLDDLNELECVDGSVWANVWHSDHIVRIDPATGVVEAILDLTDLLQPHPAATDAEDVLNGIAYDATTDRYLVTGKRWPQLIEIRLVEDSSSRVGERIP